MGVLFQIPDPRVLDSGINKKLVITGAGLSVLRSISGGFLIPDEEIEEAIGVSEYGTPILDNLTFTAGQYVDLEGNTIEYPEIIINTIVLTVNQERNIVRTPIQGRNGTVKEYVSDGDYQVTGNGVISNRDNVIPLDDLRNFRALMSVPQQLPITSQYLNEVFEIFNIVVTSFNMPQVEGKRNEVPFSFTAFSDIALGLEELA